MSDAGQEGEHEVEQLLNRRTVRGVTRYLVRWRGHTAADDEWLRPAELAHCPEKVAEYDAATPRRGTARRTGSEARPAVPPAAAPARPAAPPAAPARAPPLSLVTPAGFRLAAPSEVRAGAALVVQAGLYRWLDEGWVRGTVADKQ